MAKKKKKVSKKKAVSKKKKAASEEATTKRKLLGKFSKVGVFATWAKIFSENEKKKLTDKQILAKMEAEFPGRSKQSKVFNSVSAHRNFLNKGLHGFTKPKKKSVCYDR